MKILFLTLTLLGVFPEKEKEPTLSLSLESSPLEKRMVKIKSGLYANPYETSNFEYREFLNSIKANTSLFEQSAVTAEKWKELSEKEFMKTYFEQSLFNNFPVLNISHEGAENFCQWLTEKYNSDPKRKFKRVIFRLPSEEEWLLAARGNHTDAIFPWQTPFLRNEKGGYQCNYRRIDEESIVGKWGDSQMSLGKPNFQKANPGLYQHPDMVNAFNANETGVYNMSGNAAEMLNEKGRTKGGSWGSTGYYVRLDAEDEYKGFQGASPFIGFRYFMEVIEE